MLGSSASCGSHVLPSAWGVGIAPREHHKPLVRTNITPRPKPRAAARALPGPESAKSVAPGWELPGGVWWKTAPGAAGAFLDFSAAVTSHGEGFVMLGPVDSKNRTKKGNGLERMNGDQSHSLVLSSVLNDTSPGLALAQFGDEPLELALAPLEPWEAELLDDSDVIGSSECQGIVLRAATGQSSTTTSLAAPPGLLHNAGEDNVPDIPFSKSPRRTQPVKFTCNICKTETIRVVNPHAWTHGTVFLECSGCNIKHKVKDNLNLFHELSGPVFPQDPQQSVPKGFRMRPGGPKVNLSWRLEDLLGDETQGQ